MVPFVGPSYQLATRSADVQRSVNLYPVPVESGSGSASVMLQSLPGLRAFASGVSGLARGCFATNGRAFVVVDFTFYEVGRDGTYTAKGTLSGVSHDPVSMAANTTQVYIADGKKGYVFSLLDGTFEESRDVNAFGGSKRTAYLDQYGIWAPPDGSTFYVSSLGDAGDVDTLDFASAEAMPDKLVSFVVSSRQLYLFGSESTEVWLNTGAALFPLQRYEGTVMNVGCVATHTAQVCNGVPVWLGASKDGIGSVWMADGYTPRRISTRAVEESLAKSTDISGAVAYCWTWRGSAFYCLRAPGLDTTWVYDFLSGMWHEQAELISGAYAQHRVIGTMVAFGRVLALGDDGSVYEYDAETYTFGGDALCRERTSPHDMDGGKRQFFREFEVLADTGVTGRAMLRTSDDGGATWGDWRARSLGELGKQRQRLIWPRCGSARDRVWSVRVTDPVPFSIVGAVAR